MSWTQQIPSRAGFTKQDCSLAIYPSASYPNYGQRLHNDIAQNPVVPHGPHMNELIYNPAPLHGPPPGLPVHLNNGVDIGAIIVPGTTTRDQTLGGIFANRISRCACHLLQADGHSYHDQQLDGRIRAYPEPPGPGVPLPVQVWHGPVALTQHPTAAELGQRDVIFALLKSNFHCGNPLCQLILDPWAPAGSPSVMHVCRYDHYRWHFGVRGPTALENNSKPTLCCTQCMLKSEW